MVRPKKQNFPLFSGDTGGLFPFGSIVALEKFPLEHLLRNKLNWLQGKHVTSSPRVYQIYFTVAQHERIHGVIFSVNRNRTSDICSGNLEELSENFWGSKKYFFQNVTGRDGTTLSENNKVDKKLKKVRTRIHTRASGESCCYLIWGLLHDLSKTTWKVHC